MQNITTKRCRLRAMEPEDVDLLYTIENDPEMWRIGETIAPYSRARLEAFVATHSYDLYSPPHQARFMVESEGRTIGVLDISDFDPHNMRFSIGIVIYDKRDRGNGYGHEIIEAIKEYALNTLNMKQIWVEIDDFNKPSIALFEGCGFERCGVLKDWICYGGNFYDVYRYQLILR
ncbi:MAG: GNAT family protein [Alistipes sp.]|nr:GNAT family protein [Alistipes sp.]